MNFDQMCCGSLKRQAKAFYLGLWMLWSLRGPLALPSVDMLLVIGSLAWLNCGELNPRVEFVLSTAVVIAVVDACIGIIIQLTALEKENLPIRSNKQSSTYTMVQRYQVPK